MPAAKEGGRERTVDMRESLNGIVYLLMSGCSWRMLSHEFPNWKTVYYDFRTWRIDGTWERLNSVLREQVRRAAGRAATPSAGSSASQSVKTSKKGACGAGLAARKSTGANGT